MLLFTKKKPNSMRTTIRRKRTVAQGRIESFYETYQIAGMATFTRAFYGRSFPIVATSG